MFTGCLIVGAGGAVGAVCRYLMSLVRFEGNFPLMTFLTNFAGAVIIGMIVALAAERTAMTPNTVLFFKTGFCGGFTTFSTFSLEALTLLEKKAYLAGSCYIILSVVFCLAGVICGRRLAMLLH